MSTYLSSFDFCEKKNLEELKEKIRKKTNVIIDL